MFNLKAERKLLIGCPLIAVAMIFSCARPAPVDEPVTSIVDLVQQGDSDIFSLLFESYDSLSPDLSIGVFDSGIGGLTVLEEVLKLDRFDNETHAAGPDGRPVRVGIYVVRYEGPPKSEAQQREGYRDFVSTSPRSSYTYHRFILWLELALIARYAGSRLHLPYQSLRFLGAIVHQSLFQNPQSRTLPRS